MTERDDADFEEVRAYLEATEVVLRQLLDWRARWDRDRHLGPEVEQALRDEWKQLSQRAEMLRSTGPT